MILISNSSIQTSKIASNLAKTLTGGEIIALSGRLGAGKTVFTKGLAKGLKINEPITSPTFSIMNVYESGILTLMHCDAYRLNGTGDAESVGLSEYLGQKNCVSVVEWPENILPLLKNYKLIFVEIKYISENQREISIC